MDKTDKSKINVWGAVVKSQADKPKPKPTSLAEQINWGGKYRPKKSK